MDRGRSSASGLGFAECSVHPVSAALRVCRAHERPEDREVFNRVQAVLFVVYVWAFAIYANYEAF